MKETEDDTNRWKCIQCSWTVTVNVLKMNYNIQGNLHTQCNPCQDSNGIFQRTRTNNSKICKETHTIPHSQRNLES